VRRGVVLLLLGAAVLADVEAPLGRFARPGVPVLLASGEPKDVVLDGWSFRVDGPTPVFPPRLPCVVEDRDGNELLRLEAAPDRLVGVVGDAPQALEFGDGVRVVRGLDLEGLDAAHWRALDHFDRIVKTSPKGSAALDAWVRAGGSVVEVGERSVETGLGRYVSGLDLARALRRAGSVRPARIPRPGNVRPDAYDLVGRPAGGGRPLRSARWIVLGVAVACAVLLLLAATGRMEPRLLVAGLAVVAAAGALLGLVRPASEYAPVASGRFEVTYVWNGFARVRAFEVRAFAGPGACAARPAWGAPMLYRAGSPPWADPLKEGMVRIFVTEEVRPATRAPALGPVAEASREVRRFVARARPGSDAWRGLADPSPAPPRADAKDASSLLRVRFEPRN